MAEQYDEPVKQAIACVAASEYRKRALGALSGGAKTPSQVADETGIDPAHITNTLKELRDVEAVALIVPEETRRGRVHEITDTGEQVAAVVLDE